MPVEFPPGERAPYKGKPNTAVEQCALVAVVQDPEGRWQWAHLSPPTKGWLIDLLLDHCKVKRDRWYFVHEQPNSP